MNGIDETSEQHDEQRQWVVGECFASATAQPRFTTAAGLRERLRAGGPTAEPATNPTADRATGPAVDPAAARPLRIRPGLGVDATEWSDLCEELAKTYGGVVRPEGEPPHAVPRHSVLKHSRDNVVIGDARAVEDRFSAWLAVVNDTEMLRDHTADQQHVPGMLLIEAAIQLVTWAVGELFPAEPGKPPYYAVMHASTFDFRRFVFPLPTRLTGTFTPSGPAEPGRIPLTADVRVHQAGRDCTTVRIDLHAFDPALVFAVEDGQARNALERAGAAR
jgi:hypothetical protein